MSTVTRRTALVSGIASLVASGLAVIGVRAKPANITMTAERGVSLGEDGWHVASSGDALFTQDQVNILIADAQRFGWDEALHSEYAQSMHLYRMAQKEAMRLNERRSLAYVTSQAEYRAWLQDNGTEEEFRAADRAFLEALDEYNAAVEALAAL